MKKLFLLLSMLCLISTSLFAQSSQILLSYRSNGYIYQFVKTTSTLIQTKSFTDPAASETGYSTGSGAFGVLNTTTLPACPLNDTVHIKTIWPALKDLILRKHLFLSTGARNVKINVALDNDVQVWFNGKDISGGLKQHRTCASENGDLVFSVPDSLVKKGDNVVAVWGDIESSKGYLDLQVTGNTSFTILSSAGPNGSISPSGSTPVPSGANAAFNFTPSIGYHVDSVIVDGVNKPSASSYTFISVTANHAIRVTFAINQYTITASSGANGSISPSGAITVNYGSSQAFNFTPSTGYHVDSVIVDGVNNTSGPGYTFTNVTTNHTIRATFAINQYTITATSGGHGSISPSGAITVNYGSTQAFSFAPQTGYHVDSVIVDGVNNTSAPGYTFTNLITNHTIRVTFAINQYTIAASAGANGSISPSGVITVNYGSTQAFNFTPSTGYHVDSVIIDGVLQAPSTADTFFNVTTNHTIRATFAINQYAIIASSGANGSISPSGAITVNYGSNQAFNFTPSTGYHVDSVIVDGVLQAPSTTDTFFNVTTNHTIRVTFTINLYTVNATAGGNGSILPIGSATVAYGSDTTFTIQANPSYHVDSVSIDNNPPVSVATSPSTPSQFQYKFTNITGSHTITATFARNQYSLSVLVDTDPSTGNTAIGSVAFYPLKTLFNPGDSVTLTAFATPGYHFVRWIFPDSTSPLNNPIQITMDGNKSITGIFALNVSQQIIVNTLADTVDSTDGKTSLREAIMMANSNPGGDGISFDIVTGSAPGSKIILLHQPLPPFNDAIVLDFSNLLDSASNPLITLKPGYAPANYPQSNGIELAGGFSRWGYTPHGSIIRGLLITGFPGSGICIKSDSNLIQQNVITGNGGHGVCILDGNANTIGNTYAAGGNKGNTIYFNGLDGVAVKDMNPGDSIPPPAGNTILGNSIYYNGKLGIDLGGDGQVTLNKYPGGPTAPLIRPGTPDAVNYHVNFPAIDIASVAGTDSSVVQGYLLSWQSTTFRIEVFVNDSSNYSGFGEGKKLIGATTVTTDADSAYAWFSITSNTPLHFGQFVSATATDQFGNTSEFSQNFSVGIETRIFQADQYVINKTLSGIPLHWPDGKALYNFANSVSVSGLQPQVDSSFMTWNIQAVKPDLTPNLAYSKTPTQIQTEQWGGYPDGINNVVMIDSNWEQTTGSPAGVIAVTRVRYNAFTGEMTDVDVAFNQQNFIFGNADDTTSPANIKDMRDVATHEVGHFGGLGDMYMPGYVGWDIRMGANNEHLTMYGIIRNKEMEKRTLELGDINGINYIYSHVSKSSIDLVLLFDGSSAFQTKYNGFNPAKNSATELVQRLKPSDRISVIKLPDTVVVSLTTVDSTNLTSVINAINSMTVGGSSSIGTGLQKAMSVLNVSNANRDAMILFSAGEETGSPTALSVAPALAGNGVPLFTLGFSGSTGQALDSKLADTTGGDYFLTADTTMSLVVHQIWDELTGTQLVADTGTFSGAGLAWQGQKGIAWQGGLAWQGQRGLAWQGGIAWQGGLNWQGAVDPGTTTIQPGLNWQGSTFVLVLIPPGYPIPTGTTDSITTPSYVITPNNLPPGAQYIQGPTYAFYKIPNPAPGKWVLRGEGSNSTPAPSVPEPISLSIIAQSDVVLAVSFAKDSYSPGNVIQFQAALAEGGSLLGSEHLSGGQPITNAVVTANVTIPGDTLPHLVTLVHAGGGIYKGSFSQTTVPGSYNFQVQAVGTTPTLPQGFNRKSTQAVFVSPVYINAVIFAGDSAIVRDSSKIFSGSIFVNRKSNTGDPGVELLIGSNVTSSAGYDLKADRMKIQNGSVIGGNVYYNQLTNSGTILGSKNTPLSLPIGQFPPFAAADTSVEHGKCFTIVLGRKDTLRPGIYGDVVILPLSNLTMVPGIYQLRSLTIMLGGKLLFSGSGQTQLRIRHTLYLDVSSTLGPSAGSLIRASDILLYVGGTDAESSCRLAVSINQKSTVSANIYAVNGTIFLDKGTVATGAFFAKVVRVGYAVKLNLASAFTGSIPISKAAIGHVPVEQEQPAALPASFQLLQNYPNPFNPTTTIRYTLPQQTNVTIAIYNVLGQEVTRLVDGVQPQGYHETSWNGRNGNGLSVSSGIYFYRMKAGDFVEIKKMILMK
jgi:CSLREA domain-containing protein